jgi:RNA polymerase sigma-70 factor (ECF subfamily)
VGTLALPALLHSPDRTERGRATRRKSAAHVQPSARATVLLEPGEQRLQRSMEHSPEAIAKEMAALVQRCLLGDAHAWQRLVQSQHRKIYSLCYRFTGSCADAEDLTQEVFLKVYRNLGQFDVERGSFQTWLTTLTRNLLVDHFRRTRMERATDSLDAGWCEPEEMPTASDRLQDARPGPQEHSMRSQLQQQVQQALAQVSPELREAVILRDLQDMDYKEIAAVLHIPEGTVKSRISRGRVELARRLERTKEQVM